MISGSPDVVECDVVIVGGGLSGLACAAKLKSAGLNAIVLEGHTAIGGRVRSVRNWHSVPFVELGAELLHGTSTALTAMAAQKGWPLRELFTWAFGDGGPLEEPAPDGGVGYYYADGRLLRFDDDNVQFRRLLDHLWALSDKEDAEGNVVGDGNVEKYLTSRQVHGPWLELAEAGYANTVGIPLRDISLSLNHRFEQNWKEDMLLGEADLRMDVPMSSIAEELATGVDVRVGHLVTCVAEDEHMSFVRVHVAPGRDVQSLTYICKAAVMTTSVAMLQKEPPSVGAIVFSPPLPKAKREALSSMTMRPMHKLLVRFDTRPWPVDCHGIICGGCTFPELWFSGVGARCIINTSGERVQREEAGQLPSEAVERSDVWVVTAFSADEHAARVCALEPEAMLEALLSQLDTVFSLAPGTAAAAATPGVPPLCLNWGDEPLVGGGYCPPAVSEHPEAREVYAAPCFHNRLFFAGEATFYHMTAHGAMDSGARAAGEVQRLALGLVSDANHPDVCKRFYPGWGHRDKLTRSSRL